MNATSKQVASRGPLRLALAISLAFLTAAGLAADDARGAEIVPSLGLTRSTDGDETKSSLGLAFRSPLLGEQLESEIGIGYRKEEYYDGQLTTRMIPITASLLLRPVRQLHADAGVGWYHTRYEYESPLVDDETKQKFGVHVGGGLQMPLAPSTAIDLTGRYVFMKNQESKLVPETFDPDFWTLSLGIAFKLGGSR